MEVGPLLPSQPKNIADRTFVLFLSYLILRALPGRAVFSFRKVEAAAAGWLPAVSVYLLGRHPGLGIFDADELHEGKAARRT